MNCKITKIKTNKTKNYCGNDLLMQLRIKLSSFHLTSLLERRKGDVWPNFVDPFGSFVDYFLTLIEFVGKKTVKIKKKI